MACLSTNCGLIDAEEHTPFSGNPLEPIVNLPLPPENGFSKSPRGTPYCFADEQGNYPQDIHVESGEGDTYVWGQGGACIFRPLREVWAVTHNQPLMVWKNVDSSSYTLQSDPPTGVTHFYQVNYLVKKFIDVHWTMNWYHSIRQGTQQIPLQILINYTKISGTRFISYWEGSMILHEVTPDITAISMRNQVNASQTDASDAGKTVQQMIEKLRTGSPNWGALNP